MPDNESKQNSWVVPYNPYLLAKYDAHINVEICANVKMQQYVWKRGPWGGWSPRQRGWGTIARMFYINPNVGELFYLQYLLLNVLSPTSFEDLCTVNRILLPTFYGASCTMTPHGIKHWLKQGPGREGDAYRVSL